MCIGTAIGVLRDRQALLPRPDQWLFVLGAIRPTCLDFGFNYFDLFEITYNLLNVVEKTNAEIPILAFSFLFFFLKNKIGGK